MDRAGTDYWNKNWESSSHPEFSPGSRRTRFHRDRAIAKILRRTFEGLSESAIVLEVGCADSSILPYIAKSLNLRIAGIDYSPVGCEKSLSRLAAAGVEGEIDCCDLFAPPRRLQSAFDAVISDGLVEHFDDTSKCVSALAAFLRPGGRIVTMVPNMLGLVGLAQRLVAPSVFATHVRLTPADLDRAHSSAGLHVVASGYCLPSGFGVVSYREPNSSRLAYFIRRAAVAVLGRLSLASWFVDERIVSLPASRALSPFCYCIAERVGH